MTTLAFLSESSRTVFDDSIILSDTSTLPFLDTGEFISTLNMTVFPLKSKSSIV